MRFEYPMTKGYVERWGVLEALRELGANARDAEVTLGARMSIAYDGKRKLLTFRNEGITLDRKALLLGNDSKQHDSRNIGQHGEGMKLAFLVLSRAGLVIKVRNGRNETWAPKIEFSEKWGEQILTLDVTRSTRTEETFEVDVFGVTQDVWEQVKGLFLFLVDATIKAELPSGAIIFDAEMAGRIYCKGVLVGTRDHFQHGYVFNGLELDRDRRLPPSIDYYVVQLWQEYCKTFASDRYRLFDLLEAGGAEAQAFKYYLNANIREVLVEVWRERHGTDAMLAKNSAEQAEFSKLGHRSAVAKNEWVYDALSSAVMTLPVYRVNHRHDITRAYEADELEPQEIRRLEAARATLKRIGVFGPHEVTIKIVDFVDSKLHGLSASPILVARRELRSYERALIRIASLWGKDFGRDEEDAGLPALETIVERAFKNDTVTIVEDSAGVLEEAVETITPYLYGVGECGGILAAEPPEPPDSSGPEIATDDLPF